MYLVVETHTKDLREYFTHFIDLNKEHLLEKIESFVHHLYNFKDQIVDNVYYSKTALSNW